MSFITVRKGGGGIGGRVSGMVGVGIHHSPQKGKNHVLYITLTKGIVMQTGLDKGAIIQVGREQDFGKVRLSKPTEHDQPNTIWMPNKGTSKKWKRLAYRTPGEALYDGLGFSEIAATLPVDDVVIHKDEVIVMLPKRITNLIVREKGSNGKA